MQVAKSIQAQYNSVTFARSQLLQHRTKQESLTVEHLDKVWLGINGNILGFTIILYTITFGTHTLIDKAKTVGNNILLSNQQIIELAPTLR